MSTETCPRREDAAAFVQGALSPDERRAFEAHAAACPECRKAVADFGAVSRLLRAVPRERCSPGLEQRILARARRATVIPVRFARRVALAAAGLLLLLGVESMLYTAWKPARPADGAPSAVAGTHGVRRAQAWLAAHQTDTGIWTAGAGRTVASNAVGLTALAVLALAATPPEAQTPGTHAALERGIASLLAAQGENGLIGSPEGFMMYNHGMATVTLLELYRRNPRGELRSSIERALVFIRASQTEAGGWGYNPSPGSQPNSSVTVWPLLALIRAHRLGWTEAEPSIAAGLAWLEGLVGDDGMVGYTSRGAAPYGSETLTAALSLLLAEHAEGSPAARRLQPRLRSRVALAAARVDVKDDLYRTFFIAAAMTSPAAGGSAADMAHIRDALLASQSREGPDGGAWAVDDRWAAVGGRVYTTAMAAMALETASRSAGRAPPIPN